MKTVIFRSIITNINAIPKKCSIRNTMLTQHTVEWIILTRKTSRVLERLFRAKGVNYKRFHARPEGSFDPAFGLVPTAKKWNFVFTPLTRTKLVGFWVTYNLYPSLAIAQNFSSLSLLLKLFLDSQRNVSTKMQSRSCYTSLHYRWPP